MYAAFEHETKHERTGNPVSVSRLRREMKRGPGVTGVGDFGLIDRPERAVVEPQKLSGCFFA